MARQNEHHHELRLALIAAAEQLLAEDGPAGLSVRAVATRVGATTQSVYTLFGSKDGLISTLALRLYEIIGTAIAQAPETDDPAADLVEVAVALRGVVQTHPSLYRIAMQRIVPGLHTTPDLSAARESALKAFRRRFERLQQAGHLTDDTLDAAMLQLSALIEGLANAELRGDALRLLPWEAAEQSWRDAAAVLVRGITL